MARLKDIADNFDRAIRDMEEATERAVQRASSYVETSLAKAQNRVQGLPAWLTNASEIEPLTPPFGITPVFVAKLHVSSGRLRLGRLKADGRSAKTLREEAPMRMAASDIAVGEGAGMILLGQKTPGLSDSTARYLLLRLGPATVTSWTLFCENDIEQLHVRDALDVRELSADDLRASASNRRPLAKGIGLTALGGVSNHLVFREDAWKAVYLGRDTRGALACLAFDLEGDTERFKKPF